MILITIDADNLINSIKAMNPSDVKSINTLSQVITLISDDLNAKILTYLYATRVSTNYEIANNCANMHRDTIAYRFIQLNNNGLISIKNKTHADYGIYASYWKINHPRTHSDPIFYIPTGLLDNILSEFEDVYMSAFRNSIFHKLIERGKTFSEYYKNKKEEYNGDDPDRIDTLKDFIGVCCVCNEEITSNASYKKFRNNLYCINCTHVLLSNKEYIDAYAREWKKKNK